MWMMTHSLLLTLAQKGRHIWLSLCTALAFKTRPVQRANISWETTRVTRSPCICLNFHGLAQLLRGHLSPFCLLPSLHSQTAGSGSVFLQLTLVVMLPSGLHSWRGSWPFQLFPPGLAGSGPFAQASPREEACHLRLPLLTDPGSNTAGGDGKEWAGEMDGLSGWPMHLEAECWGADECGPEEL